jgi:hypothetical protein
MGGIHRDRRERRTNKLAPKFLTEKEYVHPSEALKLNGIANPTAFYDGCAVALIEAARKGHTIQWPPKFQATSSDSGWVAPLAPDARSSG